MVYTNWFRTLLIGQMMATNIGFAELPAKIPTLPQDQSIRPSSSSSPPKGSTRIPLLGMFTISSKGAIRLYCNEKNINQDSGVIYLRRNGNTGIIMNIKLLSSKMINLDIKNHVSLPGEFINLNNNLPVFTYSGTIHQDINEKRVAEVGILLRSNSIMQKNYMNREFDIYFLEHLYKISCFGSQEGIHANCIDYKSNTELSHYYYYIGYEIEPEKAIKQ